jgi:hypothetical protein
MKTIKIKTPFFGAGSPKQFNWVKDGHHIYGIGIKAEDLNKETALRIEVDGNSYVILTKTARDFVRKYNSIYRVNPMVRLGVFSISLLKGVRGDEVILCCTSIKTFSVHAKDCPSIQPEPAGNQQALF